MLWQRDNNRVDIYDADSNAVVNSLPVTPGMFLSPGWSPVDDRLLFGALNADGSSTDLVISANTQTTTLAGKLHGPVSFAWSPDGNDVAYVDQHGPLMEVDALTGKTVARSTSTGVLAHFWSPDSHRIAYITLTMLTPPPDGSFSAYAPTGGVLAAIQQGQAGLAWTVLDVSTGATRSYTPFLPTRDMIYLLSYFDQFAQSHRVWSPDSNHLLYSEIRPGDKQVITLLDVSQPDTVPLSIAEGSIGVWSFQ
jgi:TolB protein